MDVKQVYMSYVGRRRGLIKALTTERDLLFARCDPDIDEPLFVFGLPDGNWNIASPTEEVLPRDFPRPKLGINFRRDTDDLWLNTVALQCDPWLRSVEFHLADTSDFDEANRKRFLRMTRKLLPLYELLIWEAKKKTVPKISAMSKNIMSQADILSEESSTGQSTTDDGASTAQSRAGQPSESA